MTNPRVSIGLPVYNGEQYLAETLDSLLAQTFSDFELVISDNASTDGTEEICRSAAARDPRIRYARQDVNLGGAWNHRHVFDLSSGEYFRWAGHDDICAPEYLERCVEVLDRDPSVILCYTRSEVIDDQGSVTHTYAPKPRTGSSRPRERFYECVCVEDRIVTIVPIMIYGLVRAEVMGKTPLLATYASADGVLLGELALRGRFHEVPEVLFRYRHHLGQSTVAYPSRHAIEAWYDPKRAEKKTLPHWRLFWEHLRSIGRASPPWIDRLWSAAYVLWWARQHWRGLVKDALLTSSISGRSLPKPLTAPPSAGDEGTTERLDAHDA